MYDYLHGRTWAINMLIYQMLGNSTIIPFHVLCAFYVMQFKCHDSEISEMLYNDSWKMDNLQLTHWHQTTHVSFEIYKYIHAPLHVWVNGLNDVRTVTLRLFLNDNKKKKIEIKMQ